MSDGVGMDGLSAKRVAANNKMKIESNGTKVKLKIKAKAKVKIKKGANADDVAKVIRAGFLKASKGSILER